jgi:ubiquilin
MDKWYVPRHRYHRSNGFLNRYHILMPSTTSLDPQLFLLLALALLSSSISSQLFNLVDDDSTNVILSQIIASNPSLSSMGPQVREMMRSPMMRQMMWVFWILLIWPEVQGLYIWCDLTNRSDPAMIRQMLQMQGGMGGGSNPFGGMAGGGAAQNPLVAGLGAMGGAGNAPGTPADATAGGAGAGTAPPNPFGMNPDMMRNLMGFGGMGGAGGAGGFGGLGGFGGFGGAPGAGVQPASESLPQDTRSLEDRFSNQLRTLNEMGLVDPQQNLRALSMTGGNVEAAIELIFSGRKSVVWSFHEVLLTTSFLCAAYASGLLGVPASS